MTNLKSKLSFTRTSVGVASLNAASDISSALSRVAHLGTRARLSVVGGSVALYGAGAATVALAAAGASCTADAATSPIVKLFARAAMLVVTVGGIGAILMGVFGALMIMFSGGSAERAKKGMTIVKNVIIALAIMAGIYLIRFVIVTFMSGSSTAISGQADTCPSDLLNNSGNLSSGT